MRELSQFLIVFDHEQGALHQDVAVFADTAKRSAPTTLPRASRSSG